MDDSTRHDGLKNDADANTFGGESATLPVLFGMASSLKTESQESHQSSRGIGAIKIGRLPKVSCDAESSGTARDEECDGKTPNEANQNNRDYRRTFETLLEQLASPLEAVEQLLTESLQSNSDETNRLLQLVHRFGGKRLRPILTALSAYAVNTNYEVGESLPSDCVRGAAIVELVHTATLIHDDIIDGAVTRRHQPSLHVVSSTQNAVLLGDWVFTQAYALASAGDSTVPGQIVAEAARAVCEGEIGQDARTGDLELSENECLRTLKAKTGQLCGAACRLGAWAVGAKESDCERLGFFGEQLGIAFQLHDDWLDYWGEESKAGKTLLTDLETLKPTIPLIRAISQLSRSDRASFFRLLSDRPTNWKNEVLTMMNTTDASVYTRRMARQIIDRTKLEIAGLPGESATELLCRIAEVAITRGT